MNKEEKKITRNCILILIMTILLFPITNKVVFGKFTFSDDKAIEFNVNRRLNELDCEWGAVCGGVAALNCHCTEPPCKRSNVDDKDCISEGHTEKGFLGFTDWNTVYYVCKDYGRIAWRCVEYWDKEEWMEYMHS